MGKVYLLLFLAMLFVANAQRIDPDVQINGDSALVNSGDIIINIDNFNTNSGERVTLNLQTATTIDTICFEFPVRTYDIEIHVFKVSVPLFFDVDLSKKFIQEPYKICYTGLSVSSDELYFEPIYHGVGVIKYNITFNDVVLDPYLVGDLGVGEQVTNRLIFGLHFNNTLNAIDTFVANNLNNSNIRQNTTSLGVDYSGSCTTPTTIDDDNDATYGSVTEPGAGSASCYMYMNFTKAPTDTGMVFQLLTDIDFFNYTATDACFNTYTGGITFEVASLAAGCGAGVCSSKTTSVYCFNNGAWDYLGNMNGIKDYEATVYLTNQTNFTAYNQSLFNVTLYGNTSSDVYDLDPSNVINYSLKLNISKEYLNVTTIPSFNLSNTDSFTISMFIYPQVASANRTLVSKGNVSPNYGWSVDDADKVAFFNSTYNYPLTNITINESQWQHLAFVVTNGTATIYKNGSYATTMNVTFGAKNADYLYIGGNPYYNTTFNGSIDEFLFHNYPLTATQVMRLARGFDLLIDDCTSGGDAILNMTLYDEETLARLSDSISHIEAYFNLTNLSNGVTYEFSVAVAGSQLKVCVQNINVTSGNFSLDSDVKYYADNHVIEYHYLENMSISNTTANEVSLYDLNTNDSTSFLVNYQDENYIYQDGVIVDLLRQYLPQGDQYYSVEQGRTDTGGQTRLHLVTEDVVYKFNVYDNGRLLYSTGKYFALCQATPCEINLRKSDVDNFSTSIIGNLQYSLNNESSFRASNNIIFTFSTTDGTSPTMLLNVTQYTHQSNVTVCNSSVTSSSGTLTCSVPVAYQNTSYAVRLYKNGAFVGYRTYYMAPTPSDNFGQVGIFLTFMLYASLALMAISSPIASIMLGVVGLIMAVMVNIFDGGTIIGLGSTFIWLIVAAVLIIWKMSRARRV